MPKPNKLTPNNGWYDPADYITVHEDYLEGMRAALRRAHGEKCVCMYCKPSTANEVQQ